MKHICTAIITFAALSSLLAQSPYEKELQLLKEQRDKSAEAAVDPINRRYKAAVEQLVSRATQAKDLETAVKAKLELDDLNAQLPGTSWLWTGNSSMKFTFLPNGRFSGHFKDATWKVLGPDLVAYSWPNGEYSGVMRVAKNFERLDAAEWQAGKNDAYPVPAIKAAK